MGRILAHEFREHLRRSIPECVSHIKGGPEQRGRPGLELQQALLPLQFRGLHHFDGGRRHPEPLGRGIDLPSQGRQFGPSKAISTSWTASNTGAFSSLLVLARSSASEGEAQPRIASRPVSLLITESSTRVSVNPPLEQRQACDRLGVPRARSSAGRAPRSQ